AHKSGPYNDKCNGLPSGNGSGGGLATGQPCAGCVGKADEKNPGASPDRAQYPNGGGSHYAGDNNNGYECDGNHGIAQTNPAHTGCGTTTGFTIAGTTTTGGTTTGGTTTGGTTTGGTTTGGTTGGTTTGGTTSGTTGSGTTTSGGGPTTTGGTTGG